jgi:hypothetical protein
MADSMRIAFVIVQTIGAIFLIYLGVHWWMIDYRRKDEPFADYENLADCIMQNWNKRDPRQYCLKIRRKIEAARRRKRRR